MDELILWLELLPPTLLPLWVELVENYMELAKSTIVNRTYLLRIAYIKLCFQHEREILDVLTEEGLHVLTPLEVPLDLEDLPDLFRPFSLLLLLLQLLRRFYRH